MPGQLAQGTPATLRPPTGDWIPSWRTPTFTGPMAHHLTPTAPAGLLTNLATPAHPHSHADTTPLDVRPRTPLPGANPLTRLLQAARNAFTPTTAPPPEAPATPTSPYEPTYAELLAATPPTYPTTPAGQAL